MATVSIDHLTKTFPHATRPVLDHVSLEVADGEFLVLVGPSGCGKSTLLRLIAGLEDPTDGTISIDGAVVNDIPPKLRDIAMVFQNYALYPHMTVTENLGFSLRMSRTPHDLAREQVDEVAHVLALQTLLDRKPAALSGGQRQRVAMGRAMVRHPKVLLMDEPLSNLDAKLRVAMRGELMRLHQRDATTTLYVTHDQVEAMTLGDRIAVLHDGRIQQVGTPHELYHHPVNVFVAGFIGSPAMNLALGRVVSGELGLSGLRLALGEQCWPVPETLAGRLDGVDATGHDVVVGLRPGALTLGSAAPGLPRIEVTAVTVESLGDETNVLFLPPFTVPDVVRGSGDSDMTAMWTARLGPDTAISAGQTVTLAVDLAQAYVFDAATGAALHVGTVPQPAA
ncbi:trehalose import ATP-binding protein SugC [Catellatospora sp. IY07-71]|uniref:ABC transporter ATP-binding protein n=1 Tax=Catellatospora sp. IY07-71 TaxID=2728827 RepID=UPI001BB3081E|nr:ABC transporter ATP-binding protein [Catellatospora sp. IY07-71]BCJ75239.1 trehalose import ATP-binding protein SugC [Catellatospora sp. IY07-71]